MTIPVECSEPTPVLLASITDQHSATAENHANESTLVLNYALSRLTKTVSEDPIFIPCQIKIGDPEFDLEIWIPLGSPTDHHFLFKQVCI